MDAGGDISAGSYSDFGPSGKARQARDLCVGVGGWSPRDNTATGRTTRIVGRDRPGGGAERRTVVLACGRQRATTIYERSRRPDAAALVDERGFATAFATLDRRLAQDGRGPGRSADLFDAWEPARRRRMTPEATARSTERRTGADVKKGAESYFAGRGQGEVPAEIKGRNRASVRQAAGQHHTDRQHAGPDAARKGRYGVRGGPHPRARTQLYLELRPVSRLRFDRHALGSRPSPKIDGGSR